MDFELKKKILLFSGWYAFINIEQGSTLLEILNKDRFNIETKIITKSTRTSF